MNNTTTIICPEITPGAGGLADYTLRLLAHWPCKFGVCIVVPESRCESAAPNVTAVQPSAAALLEALPSCDGRVLLQYSGYGFNRLGYPRWLLRALRTWREEERGVLVLMLHEIWGFCSLLNRNFLLQQLHRRDLLRLVRCADRVFTSTTSQADYLRREAGAEMDVLPVGSNVAPVRPPDQVRDPGLAVVFGLAGTRLRVLQTLRGEIAELARRKVILKLVTVGAGEGQNEREVLAGLPFAGGFEQRGALADAELSELLLRASFGISVQDDLSVTKSGTFMAYAAHGLNIISPYAAPQKAAPLCWCTAPAELLAGIPPEELRARAERLPRWQEEIASWPRIANAFVSALGLSERSAVAET